MVEFKVTFNYVNNKSYEYILNSDEYEVEQLKVLMGNIVEFTNEGNKAFIRLAHENGIAIVTNETLQSVEFNKGIWDVVNYDTSEIEEIFEVYFGDVN